MKLDLDKAPIKEIKAIMIKMGISSYGCVEREDLRKKLIENVPELKFEIDRKQSSADYVSIDSRICKLIKGRSFLDLVVTYLLPFIEISLAVGGISSRSSYGTDIILKSYRGIQFSCML